MFRQLALALLLLAAITTAAPSVGFSNYSMPSMNITDPAKAMMYSKTTFSEYCQYDWGNTSPNSVGANLSLFGGSVFQSVSHAATTNNSNDRFDFSGLKADTYLRSCWIRTLDNQTFVSGTRLLTVSTYAGQPSGSDMLSLAIIAIGAVLLYISFGGDKIG